MTQHETYSERGGKDEKSKVQGDEHHEIWNERKHLIKENKEANQTVKRKERKKKKKKRNLLSYYPQRKYEE